MLLVPVAGRAENPSTFLKNTLDDGLSLYSSPFRLQKEDAPVALAVAGILGGSVALDRITRRNLLPYQDTGSASTLRTYGDVAQFSGPILGGAFAVSAWMTHDDYEMSASWGLFESFLWANAVSETFKISLGRRRPNATDDPFELRPGSTSGSFPSGHTISAFAAAATLSEYYPSWKVIIPSYSAAAAVGFSRIYSNQHWASDVVGGALMGYGVSHTLWKRHHQRNETSWTIGVQPGGILVSKRF